DRVLSRHCAARRDRRHQSGRRSAARHPQSAAQEVSMPVPVLAVWGLKTYFYLRHDTVKAVDGVSFSIGRGEVLGLVGESGSGKSVTGLWIMALLDPPGRVVGGSIKLVGEELLSLPEQELRRYRGSKIAMIFQDPMLTLNPVLRIDTQMIEAITAHERVSRR